MKRGVLFVCLGNICRSPTAEAIFLKLIRERNLTDKWFCDSCATGTWHTGEQPDSRTLKVLKKNGITDYQHTVRQLQKEDFSKFEFVFGMDNENIKDIKKKMPGNTNAKIELLGSYDPDGKLIIEDPYFTHDFDTTFQHCLRSCKGFLHKVEKEN